MATLNVQKLRYQPLSETVHGAIESISEILPKSYVGVRQKLERYVGALFSLVLPRLSVIL